MSTILKELSRNLSPEVIQGISGQLGIDEKKTNAAISAAAPLLIGALARNTSAADGAASLLGALTKSHDGGILAALGSYVSAGNFSDGLKILGHVFGPQMQTILQGVAKATGLDPDTSSQLISLLAPVLLGIIGKENKKQDFDTQGLNGYLQKEKEETWKIDPESMGVWGQLLDTDHDGDISDDLLSAGTKILGSFL
ncbi:MAG: DUF937 domain-containing protein [Leptospiraceae bacterium]|nr:DUF937 domain-containing protein [Leptospiraceae bacterium]